MRNLGNGFEVRDVIPGVTNTLDIYGLGLIVDGCGEFLGLVALDELSLDSEPRNKNLQLVICTTVEAGSRDNVVAGMSEGGDSHELGCLAGRSCDGSHSAFQSSDTLLEDIDGRL